MMVERNAEVFLYGEKSTKKRFVRCSTLGRQQLDF